MRSLRRLSSTALLAAILLPPGHVSAQEAQAPEPSATLIEVEQVSNVDTVGEWTLLKPGHETQKSRAVRTKIADAMPGNYTFIVEPPKGAVATIRFYRNGELVSTVDRPQIFATVNEGDAAKLTVHYGFIRVGDISVTSDPPEIPFLLKGPNELSVEGTTPQSFPSMPEGQYSVQFTSPEGCATPPVKSLLLEKGGRIKLAVTLACDAATKMREEKKEMNVTYVVINVDGQEVTLADVPQSAWFATYVYSAARGNVMSGYRDSEGNFTGAFGPENPVTVAELAKIAHRIAGIDETAIEELPVNRRARGGWFSPFIASAEARGWTVFADSTIDPLRPATRGEVLMTFLQVLDVPLLWPKGELFDDVTWQTPYAAAIETAATDGIVSGEQDADGNATGMFNPGNPINRAEMAKMIVEAIDTYRGGEGATISREDEDDSQADR